MILNLIFIKRKIFRLSSRKVIISLKTINTHPSVSIIKNKRKLKKKRVIKE